MLTKKFNINYLILIILLFCLPNRIFGKSMNFFEHGGYLLPPPATLSSITVYTWLDLDENGVKGPGEESVAGINLTLYNDHNNLIATGYTDQDGIYVFNNIPNGNYRVKFGRFSGLIPTFQNIGNDENLDSDINVSGYSDFVVIDHPSDTYNFTGGYRGNLQVFLGNNRSICLGQQVSIDANVYFGKSPFTFQWDNGLGQDQTVVVSPTETTTYSVTATDAWGFSVTNDITIKVKTGVGEEKFTIIDGFSSGNATPTLYLQVNPSDPGPKNIVDYSASELISNYRTVELAYVSGPHPAALELDYNNSYFSHSNDVGTVSTSKLCYNNNGAGMDLDISIFDYFKIKDMVIDQGVLFADISMTDIHGNSATITKKLPGLGNSVFFDKEVFISEFSLGSVDLSHISELCFYFYSKDISIDFRMGDIWLVEFTDCPVKADVNSIDMCVGDTVDIGASVSCAGMVTFVWDHNLGVGAKQKVSPSTTTTYYVTAFDGYGCSSTDTVTVNVYPKPSVLLASSMEMCKGDSVDIIAQGSGGQEPYSYHWNTGDTMATIRVSPDASTSYTVSITDANFCSSAESTIDVLVHPSPDISATSTIADCAESNGSATAVATGGTPPYSYLWQDGTSDANLLNIPAGKYYVTVTDANGCTDSTYIDVEEKDCGLIGNFVWEDLNANGVQDPNEPPLPNVRVTLLDGQNNPLDTTYTDANGEYYFYSLHPGQFYVQFTKPQDYIPSPANSGDDRFDSDADVNTGLTQLIDIAKYEKDSTFDAGFYRYASIGDTVWVDKNGDDVQNPDESGLAGLKVRLEDCNGAVLDSTVTDNEGKYSFGSLVPGEYSLRFILPDTMEFVNSNVGDDSLDSDVDPSTGTTNCEVLESGENNMTYDAGVYVPAELGDFVWEDLNADGIQDAGEPGIEGVGVILNDCQGVALDTVYTDHNGYYLFNNLKPGNYMISFIMPADYILTDKNIGTDSKDSDIEDNGYSVCEVLESSEKNYTYDIGLYRNARIGDEVWLDKNANGVREVGEPGVENVTVELRKCNGTLMSTGSTDSDGKYIFEDLRPDSYKLKFILPDDYHFTKADIGDDDTDSDADPVYGLTVCEDLISNESNLSYDAGIYKNASIGDYVWLDEDGDGLQDTNEPPFENVEVILQDCNGNDLATQFTNPNGLYLFDNLVPGDYMLKFIAPQNYSFSNKNAGADDIDSDVDPYSGLTDCESLESDEDNRNYDAGILYFGSIGDYVWLDENGDGIQQANEPPVENVELKLFHWENGGFIYKSSEFTDTNGYYLFNKIPPGDYYIMIVPPAGYDVTLVDKGNDDLADCDFGDFNGTNTTQVININPGQDDYSWDAGLYECATIGDLMWKDHIRDNVYNAGEAGINGVKIYLWRYESGNWILWDQTITSYQPSSTCGDGYWSFCTNPGTYYVEFTALENTNLIHVIPNTGDDESIDSDIDDSNGLNTSASFTLTSGQFMDDLDAGYYPEYSISGIAWKDDNGDGIRDNGEDRFENISVELYDNSGLVASTQTNNFGEYQFANLEENDYYIWFELPSNYVFSNPNAGIDDSVDSDVTDDNGANTTDWIDLSNDNIDHIDAAYKFQTQSGGLIWEGVGGENNDDYNLIWWDTKNEENVDYYEIMKGFGENGLNEILNTINSNKSHKSSYSINDYDVTKIGTYKYRISAVNSDKTKIYSNEIILDVNAQSGMSIYPNPVKDVINFDYVGAKEDEISIYILDLKGKLFYKKENIKISANSKYHLEINSDTILTNGIYQFLIKNSDNSYVLKFAKILQ